MGNTDQGKRTYSSAWYAGQSGSSGRSAERVVPLLLELSGARSVVDVGCGVAPWAHAFARAGVDDVLGIDGAHVELADLRIERERFLAMDLSRPEPVGRTFDLAVSLEVGEHLPDASAASFVEFLTSLAPVVGFSAAIPGQGGTHHINEQWPGYWAERFDARGYGFSDVRGLIWDDGEVARWYRQNFLVFANRDPAAHTTSRGRSLAADVSPAGERPMALVHPEVFARVQRKLEKRRPVRRLKRWLAARRTGGGG